MNGLGCTELSHFLPGLWYRLWTRVWRRHHHLCIGGVYIQNERSRGSTFLCSTCMRSRQTPLSMSQHGSPQLLRNLLLHKQVAASFIPSLPPPQKKSLSCCFENTCLRPKVLPRHIVWKAKTRRHRGGHQVALVLSWLWLRPSARVAITFINRGQ